ncbi:hypothetical protein AB4Y63_05510 [Leifsonia sp. YAF41]|uniref:hypothetical protein n=1 Tax=Leifsonia sp. YAF41 TaxID=3233086 RepID=UPI003F9808DF
MFRQLAAAASADAAGAGVAIKAIPTLTTADFIERITLKLPEYGGPTEYLDHLALLDRCLLDRSLSAHETSALVGLAEDLGLDRNTCIALHLEYFESPARVAWPMGS